MVGRGDDDGVDVLVVEHAPQVLDETGLEGRHGLEDVGVVDAGVGEVGVDVAERLDLDVLELREAALQRVALAADADIRDDDLVVRAEDAALGARGRRVEELAADGDARCRRAESRREIPPRDAVVVVPVVGHDVLL